MHKKYIFQYSCVLFSMMLVGIVLPKAKSNVKVQYDESEKRDQKQEVDLINFFYRPIDFSPQGISYYFTHVYNHPDYSQFLGYNLSHMIQFLQHGIQTGQNEVYAASVMKLFMQKLKADVMIDAEFFSEFLPKFIEVMSHYVEAKEASFLTSIQTTLKDRLVKIFSKYFNYFQSNPDEFMTSLAEQLAKQAHLMSSKQHIDVACLKKDVLRFLELCFGKLVWTSEDGEASWMVCNTLAYQAQRCLEQKIVTNQDAFDDMCWSLIHRYCYCIQASADSIAPHVYETIMHDLQHKQLPLLMAPEQEDMMISKREYMKSTLGSYQQLVRLADPQFLELELPRA